MLRKKLPRALNALLGVGMLLQGGLSYADDTDIFFGSVSNGVRPNIFFVLDDSGSMASGTVWNGKRWTGSSRISVLKSTLSELLADLDDNSVNVGLMTLRSGNRTTANGMPRVAVPVAELTASSRLKLVNAISSIGTPNWTPSTMSLYDAAGYLTDISGKRTGLALDKLEGAKSPIEEACQSTHIVMMSDGEPTSGFYPNDIKNLTGSTCSGNKDCSEAVAHWLRNTDQSSSLDGYQFIRTHTIGFTTGKAANNYLSGIASKGDGLFRMASDASELLRAFQEIISLPLWSIAACRLISMVPNQGASISRKSITHCSSRQIAPAGRVILKSMD